MAIIQNHTDHQKQSIRADALRAMGSSNVNPADNPSDIDRLRHSNLERYACDTAAQAHKRSTGFPQLDAILPGRGWPEKGLIEVITPHWGMGELQLLIPLMRSIVEQGKWILWISPPYLLYTPALEQAGIDTDQLLAVKLDTSCKDALWSMEKALQTESCGLILAWQNWLPSQVLHRLQQAAEAGSTLGVLFKHHDSKYSPSTLNLKIQDSYSENAGFNESEVSLIKAGGGFHSRSANINLYQQN